MTHAHKEPNYIGVFWALAVLTVVEVLLTYSPIARSTMVPLLVALAIAKASLVAMYYMHLKFEPRHLVVIATAPVLLGVLFTLALLQGTARGPGH